MTDTVLTRKQYREHLITLGIPIFVAKRMAKLTDVLDEMMPEMLPSAYNAVTCFADWASTPEGYNFWYAMAKYLKRMEAISA